MKSDPLICDNLKRAIPAFECTIRNLLQELNNLLACNSGTNRLSKHTDYRLGRQTAV